MTSVGAALAVKGVGRGCVCDSTEPVAPPPETLFESIRQG